MRWNSPPRRSPPRRGSRPRSPRRRVPAISPSSPPGSESPAAPEHDQDESERDRDRRRQLVEEEEQQIEGQREDRGERGGAQLQRTADRRREHSAEHTGDEQIAV